MEILKLIYYAVAIAAGITLVTLLVIAFIRKQKPECSCDSCKWLAEKNFGLWRHFCTNDNTYSRVFDKAPTYCKYYEPRGESNDVRG